MTHCLWVSSARELLGPEAQHYSPAEKREKQCTMRPDMPCRGSDPQHRPRSSRPILWFRGWCRRVVPQESPLRLMWSLLLPRVRTSRPGSNAPRRERTCKGADPPSTRKETDDRPSPTGHRPCLSARAPESYDQVEAPRGPHAQARRTLPQGPPE